MPLLRKYITYFLILDTPYEIIVEMEHLVSEHPYKPRHIPVISV